MSAWDELVEAPLDWKRSYKKARSRLAKTGIPGIAVGTDVPKAQKGPPEAKPIRGQGAPGDDPLKTTTSAEVFETDPGMYVVFKGVNGKYYAIFVDAGMKKVTDLDTHPGRKEAIDAVLHHHDRLRAGV